MSEPTWLERLREQFRLNQIKRRLKAAYRRKPRPARVVPPKESE